MGIRDALRAGERVLEPSALVTLATGVQVQLTAADIVSFDVQEGADSALTPGCVISAAYAMTLDNADGRWMGYRNLQNATVALFLNVQEGETWHRVPMGVFIASEVSALEQEPVIRLSGCDSIGLELAAAFFDGMSYPCTLAELWRHAVGQTRYAWQGEVPNGDAVIDRAPAWGEISVRAAMGYIAAAAGCFVQADREGALQLARCFGEEGAISVDPDSYMTLTQSFESFGPVNGLRVLPAADADGAQEPLEVRVGDETAYGETLSLENNPLFMHGAPHLRALAEGMLEQLAGLRLARVEFRWRGDPAVGVGSRVKLTDTRGEVHALTVTRQTLRFDAGFSATCACEVPVLNGGGVPRVITPEGGLNAGALMGTVDGGLLAVGSVSARSIAAGAVTAQSIDAGAIRAEHLAAGAVTAQALEAVRAHINELVAGKITTDQLYADLAEIAIAEITTANIERANIDWAAIETLTAGIATLARAEITDANIQRADINWANIISAHIGEARIDWADIERLNAAVAQIADARIGSATISTAQIDQLSATVAEAVTLTVRTGTFDYASVENLLAQAMVLRQGTAGTIGIDNLLVTSANLLNATVGELVLKGEDGKYYQVNVDSAGELTAAEVTVSAAEIAAGQTSTGRQIVETNMNVAALNATELMAQTAAIGDILTLALTAEKITAGQALLASATVPTLYTTAIRAIGDTLDISANSSIRLLVGDIDAARKSINGMMVGTRNYVRYGEKLWWDGHYGTVSKVMPPVADLCVADGMKCG